MTSSKHRKTPLRLFRSLNGQSMVEFALVLPVLLLIMYGILEFGRLFYIYSSVQNAAREGARYGLTIGGPNTNPPHYLDCSGITAVADEYALLSPITVTIGYDNGGTAFRGNCPSVAALAQTGNNPIQVGDRIIITTSTSFKPLVPLVNIEPLIINASTARTILRGISFDQSLPQPPDGCYFLSLDSSPLVGGTVIESGGTRCEEDNRFYEEDTTVTLVAHPSSIYYFDRWADDAVPDSCAPIGLGSECATATVQMTENKSAVAVFETTYECLQLTASVYPSGSGTITPNTPYNCEENFTPGWAETTVVQLQAYANSGFSFSDWDGDATGESNPTNVVFVGGDQNVTANFVADACHALVIDKNPGVGGSYTTTPPQNCPGGWTDGTVVTMTATANIDDGYDFASWSGDVTSTSPVTSVTLDSSKSVILNFSTSATCHSLVVNPEPSVGGTASARPPQNCPDGWTEGSVVTLYAAPNSGYTFDNWEGPVSDTETTPTEIQMSEDRELLVHYDFTGNDLAIIKSASRSAQVGDIITYTLTVINNGTIPASTVIVRDNLPDLVNYAGYSSTLGNCSVTNNDVTCNLGTMPAGPSSTVIYIYAEAEQTGTAVNTATVSAGETDPFQINNESTVDTVIREQTDIEILKSAPAEITQGSLLTYTLTITNNGPGAATNVTLYDTLPSSVQFVSFSSTSCSFDGNLQVTCALGNMANGDVQTIEITVIPVDINASAGDIVFSAFQDTYVDSFNGLGQTSGRTGQNFDGAGIVVHTENSADTLGLIEFDVSSFNDVVGSAVLELDVTLDGSADEISVYQINGEWNEKTVTYDNFVNNYNAITSYGSAGTADSGKLRIDITPLVQGWVAGSIPNYGLLLQGTGNGSFTWTFSDSEAQPAPKLIISPSKDETVIINSATVTVDETESNNDNNTDTARSKVSAGNAFITVSPICGEAGSDITLTGYNWLESEYGQKMDIIFEHSEDTSTTSTLATFNNYSSSNSTWSATVTTPAGAIDDFHRIRVQHGLIDVISRFQVPCPAPNLVTSRPELIGTQPITVTEPVLFNVVVTNTGNLAAISQFPVGLYFDPYPTPSAMTTHISQTFRTGISAISGLGVGQTRVLTFTVDNGFPISNTHSVYVVADSDPSPTGKIAERSETDNVSPGLSVLAVGLPPTPTPTPTPAPITATIYGRAFIVDAGIRLPQSNVEVNLYDEAGAATHAGTAFTNEIGVYVLANVSAPTTYTITGCKNIDGQDYYYSVSGVPAPANGTVRIDLILEPGICGP